jgi:cysteine desulfurase/selenocysteine lyase
MSKMAISPTAMLDPETIRWNFPILGKPLHDLQHHGERLVYLDNASTTQPPWQVPQAMLEVYARHYSNVHRGTFCLAERTTKRYEVTREQVRAFLNARSPEEVIFTSGTTMGINLVARSWGDANVRQGDEILLSEMEHHSNIVPWQQLAQRTGAILKYIQVTEDGRLDMDSLDRLLGPRTKLVGITACSNVLGTINPVEEIVWQAHAVGAVVLVDGAQSVPHQKTDVRAINADFLTFSGHKMLGPNGVGVLYGRQELLEAMPPFMTGGGMIRHVALDSFDVDMLPIKFEAGTPPIVPVIGLGAALDYLATVGMDAVIAHERRLTEHAYDVLGSIDGVRVLGPRPEHRGPVFSFTVRGVPDYDMARLLDRQGIAVRSGHHCTMPLHQRFGLTATVRASFALYNTLAEIDQLGGAIQQAMHLFHGKAETSHVERQLS